VVDYLYHFGTLDALWNGAWGLIRNYNGVAATDPTSCRALTTEERAWLEQWERENGERPVSVGEWEARRRPFDYLNQKARQDFIALFGHPCSMIGERLAPLADYADLPTGTTAKTQSTNGNIVIQTQTDQICPSYEDYEVAATRVNLLRAGPLRYDGTNTLYDPNALILLPLEENWSRGEALTWQVLQDYLITTYRDKAVRGELGPLVLRVNAGDCVELTVYNALLSPNEMRVPNILDIAPFLPDVAGDALMPKIVPLNVDKDPEHSDVSDLKPSAQLSLSIPLAGRLSQEGDNQLSVGVNTSEPALPVQDGFLQSQTLRFYAGKLELSKSASSCDDPDLEGQETCYDLKATPYAFGPIPIKPVGDVIGQGVHGLFGAVIVEPHGSEVLSVTRSNPFDPSTETLEVVNSEQRHMQGLVAVVRYTDENNVQRQFRDFVVFYQDGLNLHWRNPWTGKVEVVKDCNVCDDSYDLGERGVSYRSAPFWARLNKDK
jgi:manganese oxidase